MRSFDFDAHVALLGVWLDRRPELVDWLEAALLNVRDKETSRRRDRAHFEARLDAALFGLPALPRELQGLRGQLIRRHADAGFAPVAIDRFTSAVDPLELTVRAYEHWSRRAWPGRSGRLTVAQTLFAAHVIRQLELLTLRIWDDDGTTTAPMDRLRALQRLLDRLNATPPRWIRDVRWLLHSAQGPLTREPGPYLRVAALVAETFPESDRTAYHQAGARLAAGHLRSQLRYVTLRNGDPPDDAAVLASTRSSNAMDGALLVRDLAWLLDAYADARRRADEPARAALADGILQGLSADPGLLVTRLDLLAPYTLIEDHDLARGGDGAWRLTPAADAYVATIDRYAARLGECAAALLDDAARLTPASDGYSPFGIAYGFVADVLSNIGMSRVVAPAAPEGPVLEEMFESGGRAAEKLAQARAWTALPMRPGERAHFEHAPDWAAAISRLLIDALERRAARPDARNASATRHAILIVEPAKPMDADAAPGNALCTTTDASVAASGAAELVPASQFDDDRREGRYLASASAAAGEGASFGVPKLILTLGLGAGRDVRIVDAPGIVVDKLRLTCAGLIAPARTAADE